MKKTYFFLNLLVFCFLLSSVPASAGVYFTTNPASDTACAASTGTVTFLVAAADTSSTSTINYVWQVSTDGGATWSAATGSSYSGDSTATLTVSTDDTTLMNGYKFRCVATDSISADTSTTATVVLDAMPNAGPISISGAAEFCIGVTRLFTDPVPGGVWSSANTAVGSVAVSGQVTGVSEGTDIISYTITNPCGTSFAIDSIVIDTLPLSGIITGNDSVCIGSSLSLTDTITGGIWSSLNTAIATVSSGMVTGVSQGYDSIKFVVINDLGCVGRPAWKVVRVDSVAIPMAITGPSISCVGNYITLEDANVLGIHTWTASNSHASVSSSGVVICLSAGIDTISYIFSNACNSIDTSISIEVDTTLAHGTISGPSDVCAGSWIHLTNSLPGGFWFSDSSALAVVDGSGNVTGVSQGTVTISNLFENGCGISAAVHSLTVSISASAITASTDSIGIGDSVTLHDSTLGGAWEYEIIGGITVATINSEGVARGVDSGMAIILDSVNNACGSSAAYFSLYVGPPPHPGIINAGDDSVCISHSVVLGESVAGGTWGNTNNSIATVSSGGTLTGVSQGFDTVIYTVTNACGTSSTMQTIYVNHTPVIRWVYPGIVSLGSNYFPIATPPGGTWSSSNTTVGEFVDANLTYFGDTLGYSTATMGSFYIFATGIDTIHYKVKNSCGTTDSSFVIDVAGSNGMNTLSGAPYSLELFPNPNNGSFTLNLPSNTTEEATFAITDLVGHKVKELKVFTNNKIEIQLDQPAGIYFLTATTPTARYAAKFIISSE